MKKLFSILLVSLMLVGCSSSNNETEVKAETSQNLSSEKINIYTRDSSSGTREAFEGAIDLETGTLTANASEVSSNGDMATKVGNDINSIGYVSLTTDFTANNVTPLSYNGVDASIDTVLDGTYTMQRPFNFVTRATGDFESEDIEQLVDAFVAYITESEEGLAVIESKGGIVDYSNAKSWEEIAKDYPVLNNDNSGFIIRTGGSTSVEKVIKAALIEFQAVAGNVQFAMDQTGSSDGQKRVLGEEKDGASSKEIGFASRPFKDTEDVSGARFTGAFCKDAVVVIVNDDSSLTDINTDTINGIYTGAIDSFSEVE
jgi:phosphate transport system substrate-binding protein